MKTTKLFLAAVLALGLAACTENEPEITVNCCCGGSTVEAQKLVGYFSVSKKHKVRFAPGNLQYNKGTWRFADEQFIYLGYTNDQDVAEGWTQVTHDLFAFGQTGYSNSEMKDLTDTDKSYYGGYNKNNNTCDSIDGTNWDWGLYCAIENGGNQPGLWRTLSKAEWEYLLEKRNNAEKLYAPSMVAGRRGVILLADNYKNPDGVTRPNPDKSFIDGYNVYCYEDWKKLEAGGAVFLPCGGVRKPGDSYTYYPEMSGYYWTTTNYASNNQYAWAVQFGYECDTKSYKSIQLVSNKPITYKYYRCSVRLVQEYK
jgi:hypothetical protein